MTDDSIRRSLRSLAQEMEAQRRFARHDPLIMSDTSCNFTEMQLQRTTKMWVRTSR